MDRFTHSAPPPRVLLCTVDGKDCWTPNCCPTIGCLKAAANIGDSARRDHGPVVDLDRSEWRPVEQS